MENLSKELKDKLNTLAVVSNEHRFNILLALLASSTLKLGKHSHTFTELKEILNLSNPDLSYHLNSLRGVGLITKKEYTEKKGKVSYYSISSVGKDMLKSLGLTSKQVWEAKQKVMPN
ncbi:MAG: helix-turn-helix domain-containing protein [archaeon]